MITGAILSILLEKTVAVLQHRASMKACRICVDGRRTDNSGQDEHHETPVFTPQPRFLNCRCLLYRRHILSQRISRLGLHLVCEWTHEACVKKTNGRKERDGHQR
jgi:hypothetical protein